MACFRYLNEMRLGVYALCPTFAGKKRKEELPEKGNKYRTGYGYNRDSKSIELIL